MNRDESGPGTLSKLLQSAVPLILPGLLPLAGVYLGGWLSQSGQLANLVLERKLQSLEKYCSISLKGPADRTFSLLDLKQRVRSQLERPNRQFLGKLIEDYTNLLQGFARWAAEQTTQAILTETLVRYEAPKMGNVSITAVDPYWMSIASDADRRSMLQRMLRSLDELSREDMALNVAVMSYVKQASEYAVPGGRLLRLSSAQGSP